MKTNFPLLAMWSAIAQGTNGDVVASPRHSLKKARNYFSFILSTSESAEKFVIKMRALARHACDEHAHEVACFSLNCCALVSRKGLVTRD